MFDGRNVSGLIVLGGDDAGLVLELPLVLEVDVLAIGVCHAAAKGVEDGRTGAQIPLLDHGGVDVDILMPRHQLPNLGINVKSLFTSQNLTKKIQKKG